MGSKGSHNEPLDKEWHFFSPGSRYEIRGDVELIEFRKQIVRKLSFFIALSKLFGMQMLLAKMFDLVENFLM